MASSVVVYSPYSLGSYAVRGFIAYAWGRGQIGEALAGGSSRVLEEPGQGVKR